MYFIVAESIIDYATAVFSSASIIAIFILDLIIFLNIQNMFELIDDFESLTETRKLLF